MHKQLLELSIRCPRKIMGLFFSPSTCFSCIFPGASVAGGVSRPRSGALVRNTYCLLYIALRFCTTLQCNKTTHCRGHYFHTIFLPTKWGQSRRKWSLREELIEIFPEAHRPPYTLPALSRKSDWIFVQGGSLIMRVIWGGGLDSQVGRLSGAVCYHACNMGWRAGHLVSVIGVWSPQI